MSFKLMAEVFDVKVGSPIRKMVLLKLADQANDNGECYPSYETIANACELSRRSVITHIKWLEENGYLRIEHRYNHEAKKNFSNMYHLTLSKASNDRKAIVSGAGFSLGGSAGAALGSEGAALGSEGAALGGSAGAAPEPINIEPINEPINEPNKDIAIDKKKQVSDKEAKFDPKSLLTPSFIHADDWEAYHDMRAAKKKIASKYACELLIKKLTAWHEQGLDTKSAIENSIVNNWIDIFKPKADQIATIKNKGVKDGYSQQSASSSASATTQSYMDSLRRDIPAARTIRDIN